MNKEKLDALYARATDERTPEEERRSCAVLYLKHAPKSREPTLEELRASVTKEMFHTLFAAEIEVQRKAITEQTSRADAATKRAEKAEAELKELKGAIKAARDASVKLSRIIDGETAKPTDQKNWTFDNGYDYFTFAKK